MEREESLSKLELLKRRLEEYELKKTKLENATCVLNEAKSRELKLVVQFDKDNKQRYINYRIGQEPVKPKGAIKIAVPLYRSKMKDYEKKYDEYKDKYEKCLAEYYEKFAEQRNKLIDDEKAEIENDIRIASENEKKAENEFNIAKHELDSDTTLSTKFKRTDIVDTLIGYFQDQRADSTKEAVNLYFEEEHRKRLEEFVQEQVRLTAEAKEFARLASESAEEAASDAYEAINRANEAISRADEAYNRAEEAYSEAQNAYWNSSSNSGY